MNPEHAGTLRQAIRLIEKYARDECGTRAVVLGELRDMLNEHAREAPTATHRRPSSGAMRLDLESAKTEPAPPTEAGEAFAEATRKLGG